MPVLYRFYCILLYFSNPVKNYLYIRDPLNRGHFRIYFHAPNLDKVEGVILLKACQPVYHTLLAG